MNLQPTDLENEYIRLVPLGPDDFERLYQVASDPLVWEQHPNKERYKREIFKDFFAGAMDSGGAFLIIDKKTGAVAGTSRFYEYDENQKTMSIGYTFFGRSFWGGVYNKSAKWLMLNYAFQYVDEVIFHIGAYNHRSQKAIEKLGAIKFHEETMAYLGEPTQNLNYFYRIKKSDWKPELKNPVNAQVENPNRIDE